MDPPEEQEDEPRMEIRGEVSLLLLLLSKEAQAKVLFSLDKEKKLIELLLLLVLL